ncbi:MAG: DUF5615 family PIN-like protein [Thermomicrobiales bacterium]
MAIQGISIRLYLDHNVHPQLAEDFRHDDFDVVVTRDAGHHAFEDDAHLRWATQHGRVLFTYDRSDFLHIASEWYARGDDHAGIIVSVAPPRLGYSVVLQRLLNLLDQVTAEEMINRVGWLDSSWQSGSKA